MNEQQNADQLATEQLIVAKLESVAGLADHDVVADRLGDIERRVHTMERRRTALATVAAVTLIAGGFGAWSAFGPGAKSDPEPAKSPAEVSQTITGTAVDDGNLGIDVAMTISGKSGVMRKQPAKSNSDQATESENAGAGSLDWTVSLDGNVVTHSEVDRQCAGKAELDSYEESYFADEPLELLVDKPGTYALQIVARYCGADGEVLTSVEDLSVDVGKPTGKRSERLLNGTQLKTDSDNDGVDERVVFLFPAGPLQPQGVQIIWKDGYISTIQVPNDNKVDASGVGPYLEEAGYPALTQTGTRGKDELTRLFRVIDRKVELVTAVMPDGSLVTDLVRFDPLTRASWSWEIGYRGLYTYRAVADDAAEPPATLEMFEWKPKGKMLTRVPGKFEGCFKSRSGAGPVILPRPC